MLSGLMVDRARHSVVLARVRGWIGLLVTVALLVVSVSHSHACGNPQQMSSVSVSATVNTGDTDVFPKAVMDAVHCHGCVVGYLVVGVDAALSHLVSAKVETLSGASLVGKRTLLDPPPPKA